MTFHEFVVALSYFIKEKSLYDTAVILLNEVTNDVLDLPRSEKEKTRIKSYTRINRNIAYKFVKEINDYYDRKFLEFFLTDLKYERQRLCEAFYGYCPGINEDNAINLVVDLFEEILDSAGSEKKSTLPHKKESKLSNADLKNIQEIITQLQLTVENLLDTSILVNMHKTFFKDTYSYWRNEYEQNYKLFLKQNMELRNYAVIYPELEVIETIFNLSRTGEFSIITGGQIDFHSEFNDAIIKYRRCLEQLLKIINEK